MNFIDMCVLLADSIKDKESLERVQVIVEESIKVAFESMPEDLLREVVQEIGRKIPLKPLKNFTLFLSETLFEHLYKELRENPEKARKNIEDLIEILVKEGEKNE